MDKKVSPSKETEDLSLPKKGEKIPLEVVVELDVGAVYLEHAASLLQQKGMTHTANIMYEQAKKLKNLLR